MVYVRGKLEELIESVSSLLEKVRIQQHQIEEIRFVIQCLEQQLSVTQRLEATNRGLLS